jgi:nitroimidazol reductase NimA-like FMN-containing flavoprotein (pyridoxamine 5'-phosphate oxidase superfamily)
MSEFAPTARSRARRRPQRVAYDEAAVYAVLDAGVLGHVGYVIGDQPFVTPTAYWRDGRKLHWHGAAASRMLKTVGEGLPVCLTVSFLDGFVLGRSGFAHSLNYRSVMAFGRAHFVEDLATKAAAMEAFTERLYPGRTAGLRPTTEAELMQIALAEMTIEEASAKVRTGGVAEYAPDEGWPAWSGVIPLEMRLGAPIPTEPGPFSAPRVAFSAEGACTFAV